MQVLIRLIGADEHIYTNYMDSTKWLEHLDVLEVILDKFNSSVSALSVFPWFDRLFSVEKAFVITIFLTILLSQNIYLTYFENLSFDLSACGLGARCEQICKSLICSNIFGGYI